MPVILALIGRGLAWFIGSAPGMALLKQAVGWLTDWVKNRRAMKAAQEKAQADANKSIQDIQKAKTKEEIDAGIDNALDDF